MKPTTKLQRLVVELSDQLPRITLDQEKWAHKECLQHKGYANKSSAFCLDCGNTFSLKLISRKRAVCPHCQTKLVMEETRKTIDKQVTYFAITHIVEDFQVVENFELIAYYKKDKPVTYFLHAILEYWISPNGKVQMIGLIHNLNYCCDSWVGNWEIRKESTKYWNNNRKYNIHPYKYHPKSVFKPEYLKIGINHNLDGLTVLEAIKILPNESKAETLLKAKQFSLLSKFSSNSSGIHRFWPSIRICIRNKYNVKDAGIYLDYIELLHYFNKDLRNAKYVCPKDLKKVHDHLVSKKRQVLQREEAERKRLKALSDQSQFIKDKLAFFGLSFSKGNITIKVLESIEEFIEEGEVLHHCVFTNEYYARKESLILSARVEGKPVETIEVSLDKLKIVQSRGLQNNPSVYNKDILKLLRKNLPAIRKRMVKPINESNDQAIYN